MFAGFPNQSPLLTMLRRRLHHASYLLYLEFRIPYLFKNADNCNVYYTTFFFRPLCACFYTRRSVTLTFIPSSLLTSSNHFRLNQSWIRRWVGSCYTEGGDCAMLSSFHKIYGKILIGHIRVQKTLTIKTRLSAKRFL